MCKYIKALKILIYNKSFLSFQKRNSEIYSEKYSYDNE